MDPRRVAGEEGEAVQKLRQALQNPHGTRTENRERVLSAWQTLRSVASSPDVESRLWKPQRKKRRLEAKFKRKKEQSKIEGENSKEEKYKALHEAAQMGEADRVRELVSLGSRVSSKDNSGYSALHWASLYGHVEVVRVLLNLGAGDGKRINYQNDAGNTALHLACIGRHGQVAAMLQIYKPDAYLLNNYEESPVSLGLRKLLESVEKIQRLDDIQALRMTSRSQLVDCVNYHVDAELENDMTKVPKRSWEEYDRDWQNFVERFTGKAGMLEGTSKSPITVLKPDAIHFEDVPWPVTGNSSWPRHCDKTYDKESLLLVELGVTGTTLGSLIQRERLRWHPDKFVQLFGQHLALEDKTTILEGVQTVCQLLNSFADNSKELDDY